MSDTLDITINFAEAIGGVLGVEIVCHMTDDRTDFTLEALTVGNGVAVTDLAVRAPDGSAIPFEVYQATLTVKARAFTLAYTLRTPFTVCIGVDNARVMMYPFATPWEVFFGSGALAYPADWHSTQDDLLVTCQIVNLPLDFGIFTSLAAPDEILPAQLPRFFMYASLDPAIRSHHYSYQNGHTLTFNLLVQDGKDIPIPTREVFALIDAYLGHLEKRLAPYDKTDTINILILQAAADFQQIAYGQTFATGENVINGITCYAPADSDYLDALFGYRDYAYYLHDGLTHELTHLYTSAGGDAEHKAILYPAHDCRRRVRRLIGEALAGYAHSLYMHRDALDGFVTGTVARWLNHQQANGLRSPHLDLFSFDVWLRAQGSTLLDVFAALVRRQQHADSPFDSAAILFEAAETDLGILVPTPLQDQMTGDAVPDYPALVSAALAQIGYALVAAADGTYVIEPGAGGAIEFV
jgi:hypothetical protein